MNKPKFYETKEFLELNAEWDKKLEDSGFEDIEKTEYNDFVRPQEFTKRKVKYEGGFDYYKYCQLVLREYDFKRDIDRFIFECHTEGLSVRDIEIRLAETSVRKLKYRVISDIINKIKSDFKESSK